MLQGSTEHRAQGTGRRAQGTGHRAQGAGGRTECGSRRAVRGERRRNGKMGRQGDGGLGDGFLLRAHTDLL